MSDLKRRGNAREAPTPSPDPAARTCAAAGALALALLGALGALAIGVTRGSLEKDPSIVMTMAVFFAGAGAVAGWFGGRSAARLIETGDTFASGAGKVGGSAAGVGAAVGCLGGLPFGALGCVLGGLLGAAAFAAVGAGLGVLFVALKR
jgi:hypothetical protein